MGFRDPYPAPRLAYDRDGTVGLWKQNGRMYDLPAAELGYMNSDNDAFLYPIFETPIQHDENYGVVLIFPRPVHIYGMNIYQVSRNPNFYSVGDRCAALPIGVRSSRDSTNGVDGTWTRLLRGQSAYAAVGLSNFVFYDTMPIDGVVYPNMNLDQGGGYPSRFVSSLRPDFMGVYPATALINGASSFAYLRTEERKISSRTVPYTLETGGFIPSESEYASRFVRAVHFPPALRGYYSDDHAAKAARRGSLSVEIFGQYEEDALMWWNADQDLPVDGSFQDWGDAQVGSSEDRVCRLKNTSDTKTATFITVGDAEDAGEIPTSSLRNQFLVSLDGENFHPSIEISAISPGALSPRIWIRRITPRTATEGLWTARISSKIKEWR